MFGAIHDGEIRLNTFGTIVREEWLRTEAMRREVRLDAFVVMPNHFHGIVVIEEVGGAEDRVSSESTPFASPAHTLGALVRGFKTSVTVRINTARDTPRAPFWQRSFYDHIIDDEDDLEHIRYYIQTNPATWDSDPNQ